MITALPFPACLAPTRQTSPHRASIMTATTDTSLDTIETTAHPTFAPTYQEHRRRHCEPEWTRSLELYAALDQADQSTNLQLITSCRSRAWFVTDPATLRVRVMSNACRLRWCPLCAQARRRSITVQVADWLRSLSRPKLLTLTLRHSDAPLAHQVASLFTFFRNFRRVKQIRTDVRGGIWFFQIKLCPTTGQWHPHLHCILDANFLPQRDLAQIWLRTTMSSNVVDIRSIWKPDEAAAYVARYCSRPTNIATIATDDAITLHRALHSRRTCGAWGTARGVCLTPKSDRPRSAYINLGSYRDVLRASHTLTRARQILGAWISNRPLPPTDAWLTIGPNSWSLDPPVPTNLGLEDFLGNLTEIESWP